MALDRRSPAAVIGLALAVSTRSPRFFCAGKKAPLALLPARFEDPANEAFPAFESKSRKVEGVEKTFKSMSLPLFLLFNLFDSFSTRHPWTARPGRLDPLGGYSHGCLGMGKTRASR